MWYDLDDFVWMNEKIYFTSCYLCSIALAAGMAQIYYVLLGYRTYGVFTFNKYTPM